VLALLREGLSDQAIAGRMGISLDGAKYHVREILSKLGVSSRHEAAAWERQEPVPARRWLGLPLLAPFAGALGIPVLAEVAEPLDGPFLSAVAEAARGAGVSSSARTVSPYRSRSNVRPSARLPANSTAIQRIPAPAPSTGCPSLTNAMAKMSTHDTAKKSVV